ncbi:MAG: amidohydrolase family protein [Clostridiales bacterium]|nr:amidohydrolase family protein [Clostridiales bacterium]
MFEQQQEHFARLADAFDLPLSESQRTGSLDQFVREMDEAEVEISVVPGRKAIGVTNGEMLELEKLYPGRFIVFPYIDPMDGLPVKEQVDRYLQTGKCRGVSIEPTHQPSPYAFDHPKAFEMYEILQEAGLPLFISYSAKLMELIDPDSVRQLGVVVYRFPNLKLVIGHGGWPWHREVMAMAFNDPNVYMIPDMYGLAGAGGEDYVKAANTILKDQMLFGTAYPIISQKSAAAYYETCGIKESVLSRFFYDNAAKLLTL